MYNNLRYTGNPALEQNQFSSGSNWQDALAGAVTGFLSADNNNQPGQYYVDSNYVGNGLARGGIGYMKNQRYKDPLAYGKLITSNLRQNKYTTQDTQPYQNLLSRIFKTGNLGNVHTQDYLNQNVYYPTSIYDNGDGIFGDLDYSFSYPSYNDGGSYGNFLNKVSNFIPTNNNLSI